MVIKSNEGRTFEKEYSGEKSSTELKGQFQEVRPGDTVRFEKLVAIGPDSIARELAPLSYQIR